MEYLLREIDAVRRNDLEIEQLGELLHLLVDRILDVYDERAVPGIPVVRNDSKTKLRFFNS